MRRFDNGVEWYKELRLPVAFPEGDVCCRWCPMMRADAGGSRHLCIATGLILPDIDRQPEACPLEGDDDNAETV